MPHRFDNERFQFCKLVRSSFLFTKIQIKCPVQNTTYLFLVMLFIRVEKWFH